MKNREEYQNCHRPPPENKQPGCQARPTAANPQPADRAVVAAVLCRLLCQPPSARSSEPLGAAALGANLVSRNSSSKTCHALVYAFDFAQREGHGECDRRGGSWPPEPGR